MELAHRIKGAAASPRQLQISGSCPGYQAIIRPPAKFRSERNHFGYSQERQRAGSEFQNGAGDNLFFGSFHACLRIGNHEP